MQGAPQEDRISFLTSQLKQYHLSTHQKVKIEKAPSQPYAWNPAIKLPHDPEIPEIFEQILEQITQEIADEHLTDDYSLRQSIQFLLAAKKLNSEDPNYSIDAHLNSKGPDVWIPFLATALVRKESCVNSQIKLIGTENWEALVSTFLFTTPTWESVDQAQLASFIQKLHPSINPENSAVFLQEKSGLTLPNCVWTPSQLTLLAALEIHIKAELTRFILEFTSGAKGRLKSPQGGNGQCGSEYSPQGLNAIWDHKDPLDTPNSTHLWVERQLYHFRFNQMRSILLPNHERRTETFFFSSLMRTIELLENPNLDLDNPQYREIFNREISPKNAVLHLQAMIIQNQSHLLKLAQTPEEKKQVNDLMQSECAIYAYLSDLGMLFGEQLSIDPATQTKQINRLILGIFILSPEIYLPSINTVCNSGHALYAETTQILRIKFADEVLACPHLTLTSRSLIEANMPIMAKGILATIQEGIPQDVTAGISKILEFIGDNNRSIEVLNSAYLVESILNRFNDLDAPGQSQVCDLLYTLSKHPQNRFPLSETSGMMQLILDHSQQHPTLVKVLLNIATDSQTHFHFLASSGLINIVGQTVEPQNFQSLYIVEAMSKNAAFYPFLMESLDQICRLLHHTTIPNLEDHIPAYERGGDILNNLAGGPEFSTQMKLRLPAIIQSWQDPKRKIDLFRNLG